MTVIEIAAVGDDRFAEIAIAESASRKEPRVRVNRPVRVVKAEGRSRARQQDVGVVERRYRSDVGPVAAEEIRCHAIAVQGQRDDLAAEVRRGKLSKYVQKDLA